MLDNFYTIEHLDYTPPLLVGEVSLIEGHEIYRGHFPERAIVPGVCSLAIVKALAERALGHRVAIRHIGTCKYIALLEPATAGRLSYRIELEGTPEGDIRLRATGYSHGQETEYIKLRATLSTLDE